jgi:hypothetical protein
VAGKVAAMVTDLLSLGTGSQRPLAPRDFCHCHDRPSL